MVRKGAYPHLLVTTTGHTDTARRTPLYGLRHSPCRYEPGPAGPSRIDSCAMPPRLPKVWPFIVGEMAKAARLHRLFPRLVEGSIPPPHQSRHQGIPPLERFTPCPRGFAAWPVATAAKRKTIMSASPANRLASVAGYFGGGSRPGRAQCHRSWSWTNASNSAWPNCNKLRGRGGPRRRRRLNCILISAGQNGRSAPSIEGHGRNRRRLPHRPRAGPAIRAPANFWGGSKAERPRWRFGDLARDGALVQRARDLIRGRAGHALTRQPGRNLDHMHRQRPRKGPRPTRMRYQPNALKVCVCT